MSCNQSTDIILYKLQTRYCKSAGYFIIYCMHKKSRMYPVMTQSKQQLNPSAKHSDQTKNCMPSSIMPELESTLQLPPRQYSIPTPVDHAVSMTTSSHTSIQTAEELSTWEVERGPCFSTCYPPRNNVNNTSNQ